MSSNVSILPRILKYGSKDGRVRTCNRIKYDANKSWYSGQYCSVFAFDTIAARLPHPWAMIRCCAFSKGGLNGIFHVFMEKEIQNWPVQEENAGKVTEG
ncbi:unnamed protein product [Clonostachys chloroleuca]|uniref:Uncharacterized protein n=1 Tax=Clonostachys chloroleuca TaxID=1926264 RepID=A0AA35LZD3_9HYPO|nr:unnamed protein product [Clonostachys chloroleuca]